jgi:hypothetical protein
MNTNKRSPLRDALVRLFNKHPFVMTGLAFASTITGVAALLIAVEPKSVHSLQDGLWFAWVSLTGVGYGDIVPKTNEGRLVTALLILVGKALFTLFNALLDAFILWEWLKRRRSPDASHQTHLLGLEARLHELKEQCSRIEVQLHDEESRKLEIESILTKILAQLHHLQAQQVNSQSTLENLKHDFDVRQHSDVPLPSDEPDPGTEVDSLFTLIGK